MLDNQADDTEIDDEAEIETPEAEEPEEVSISIEGEEADDDEAEIEAELGDKGRNALKAARDAAKAARQEARELKARLADIDARTAKPEPELVRPTMEDCGYNDDVFAEKMEAYVDAKKAADGKRTEAETTAKQRETEYREKLERYHAERGKVGVDDDAQDRVINALSAQQQTALMDASGDPTKVVAALAKTPKVLAELAGIKEIHRFTYRLAQIEGKIQMTTKSPPPPETRLKGAVASTGGSLSAQLDAAEKKAEATGDRSEVARIKRQIRDAGVKA